MVLLEVILTALLMWEPDVAVDLGTISSSKLRVITHLSFLLSNLQGEGERGEVGDLVFILLLGLRYLYQLCESMMPTTRWSMVDIPQ
jgi:hypothetical protein